MPERSTTPLYYRAFPLTPIGLAVNEALRLARQNNQPITFSWDQMEITLTPDQTWDQAFHSITQHMRTQ